MRRRVVFAFPWLAAGLISARRPLCANPANGDPRKEKLYAMFIAPCCWRQNLLVHESPEAKNLRAQIVQWIDEGRSDEAIKQELLQRYTARILALPEGARGQWLSWSPVVATVGGLTFVAASIFRSIRSGPAPAVQEGKLPDLPDSEWTS